MTFSQPIAVEDLKSTLSISANPTIVSPEVVGSVVPASAPIEFDINYPDPNNQTVLDAHFKRALPRNAAISLDIPPGLKGKMGPLPSRTGTGYAFFTHGDLVLHTMECNNNYAQTQPPCQHGTKDIRLMFTNPVDAKELRSQISIDPSTAFVISNENPRILMVTSDWQASKTYKIKVKKELRDRYGESLRVDFENKFEIGPRAHQLVTGFVGDFFTPTGSKPLEVVSLNNTDLELAYTPLDEKKAVEFLLDSTRPSGIIQQAVKQNVPLNQPFVYRIQTEKLFDPKTKKGAFLLEFTGKPMETRKNPQVLMHEPEVEMEPGYAQSPRQHSEIVRSTDIVLTAKVSSFGSFMRITRASTGEPIAGAQLSIYQNGEPGKRPPPTTITADANGFIQNPVKLPHVNSESEVHDALFVVRSGDDWTFFQKGDEVRFGIDYYSSPKGWPFGVAFSDRQLYRPGETVHIKGIMRQETRAGIDQHAYIPKGMKIPVMLRDTRGKTAYEKTLEVTRFGTFSFDFNIPESAPIGGMSMSVKLDGHYRTFGDFGFNIAEYRPNEITVQATSAKEAYIRGETPSFEVHAESYSGVPMASKSVTAILARDEVTFRPPNLFKDFANDDRPFTERANAPGKPRLRKELKLDASGAATFDALIDLQDQHGPERLTCFAEMFEAGGQPVATNASVLIHPASFYVAIDGKHESNGDLLPRVLAVDPRGNRISSVAVHVELMKQVRDDTLGNYHFETLRFCDLKTRDVPESCALSLQKLRKTERYLVRASAIDGNSRKVAASQWVNAADFADKASSPFNEALLNVKMTADQKEYRVGDTAKILLESPFERAEALVTVERMGIFRTFIVEVTGSSPTVNVPVTGDMWPNADVGVILTDLRQKNKGALLTNRRGRLSLQLKPEERTLSIALKTPKSAVKPGSPVDVEIDVRDPKGQPAVAEVTLYAVDEGILSLTGEKRPDPIAVFAKHRNAYVVAFDSRRLFGVTLSPAQALDPAFHEESQQWLDGPWSSPEQTESLSGGSGDSNGRTRHDFRSTAYFNPSLITDAQGKAKVTFTVPESFSSYRIVAVAVQDNDMMGSTETTIRTTHELMLRPITPRFFRAGDTAYVGAVVSSQLPGRNEIELELKSEGFAPTGDDKKRITLERGQSKEVRFEVKTGPVGKGKLRMVARSGKTSDAFVIDREIRLPVALETVAFYGETKQQQTEQMGPIRQVRTDVGGMDIELSNSVLVGLSDTVAQLEAYPYSCTEQLVSRLVATIASRTLAHGPGTSQPPGSDPRALKIIAEIEQAQRSHGSFGYWPDSSNANVFVTAYALLGLSVAKQNGIAVPDAMIDKAAIFLLTQLASSKNHDDHDDSTDGLGYAPALVVDGSSNAQKLWSGTGFLLDALVEAEIANKNAAQAPRLREVLNAAIERRKDLEPSSLAMLLHAARRAGSVSAPLLDNMTHELEASIRLDGPLAKVVEPISETYNAQLDSPARTTALALRALLVIDPAHPMAAGLARGLLSERRGTGWGSTQEDAWALVALSDYKRAQENKNSGFSALVSISGNETGRAVFKPGHASVFHFAVPISTMVSAKTLDFSVEGQGTLFYSARVKYAPTALPTEPLEHGAFIQRSQRTVNAETIEEALYGPPGSDEATLKEGDLVLVDLVVALPTPRNNLVIEDPIAAGLEPVNKEFKTTAQWILEALSYDHNRQRRRELEQQMTDESGRPVTAAIGYQQVWHRQELRDDRALFFVEHAPAGVYRFQYLARAITPGTFQKPPAKVEDMYAPEVYGRSAGSVVRIR